MDVCGGREMGVEEDTWMYSSLTVYKWAGGALAVYKLVGGEEMKTVWMTMQLKRVEPV